MEDKGLRLAAILYSAVMFAAFVIGLYGLFSLFWLASNALERTSYITGAAF